MGDLVSTATCWDYEESVAKMRPLVARWKSVTDEFLGELYRAREELSRKRANVPNGTKTWESYLDDVGLARRTVHRWLEQYDPETGTRVIREPDPAPQSEVVSRSTAIVSGDNDFDDEPEVFQGLQVAPSPTDSEPTVGPDVFSSPEKKVHVSNNSGENEWYTPSEYIAAARRVMGGIDLDPASCAFANQIVRAERFYSIEDNGLILPWSGRVWMNPPYSGDLVGRFVGKLVRSRMDDVVTQACVLVNNATETQWFQEAAHIADAICFPKGRIRYLNTFGERSKTPLQGQAVLYFGERSGDFGEVFSRFGEVFYGK